MTDADQAPLPEYQRPPVIEVVCGAMFQPINSLLAPHLGLLWAKLRSEFPHCQEVLPLAPVIERPDGQATVDVELSDIPPLPRIWFVSDQGNAIVQVQRDRLHYNWKKVEPQDEYPRYSKVLKNFQQVWELFQSFLSESNLGRLQPKQYELTYINHIPQGDGWETLADVGGVFPDMSWRQNPERFLPEASAINWRTSFMLPDQSGRLHVSVTSAIRLHDKHPMLRFDLTVRSFAVDGNPDSMWPWFDLAHEWIVRGFADMTSAEIQRDIWRRQR